MKKLFYSMLFAVMAITAFSQKNVLVEELTGSWCQYCPKGIYYGDSLLEVYDNVMFVAIHTNDEMGYEEYFEASGMTAAPTGNIGRHYLREDVEYWFDLVEEEMGDQPKATLSVVNQFNATTRVLTSTITATALEAMSGAYRLSGIVVEDAVTGPSPKYDQSNAYSGGGYGYVGGFERMPNPIPANRIAYDHVARYLMGGYSGDISSFPHSVDQGQIVEYTYTYTVPEEYDVEYLRVIAVLISGENGRVDNVAISTYIDGSENAAPIFTSTPITETFVGLNYMYNIYTHDTEGSTMTIEAESIPGWITFENYDNNSAVLYGVPTEEGEYHIVLRVSDGEKTTYQEYDIVVNSQLDGSWEILGTKGFMSAGDYVLDMCADNQGVLYAFVREGGNAAVYKNDRVSGDWTKMNMASEALSTTGTIAVDSQNNLYIAYATSSNSVFVKKWDGSSWVNVGDLNKSGMNTELAIDDNGVLYLLFMDFNDNYLTYLYKYENNTWSKVGGSSFTTLSPAWAKLAVSSQNEPYVLWTDFYSGTINYVSKFDGAWSLVGGGAVTQDFGSYYYQDIEFDNEGALYVSFCVNGDYNLVLYKFDGTSWTLVNNQIGDGGVNSVEMDFDSNNNLIVAYGDLTVENKLSVKKLEAGEWSYIGQKGCSESGTTMANLVLYDDIPYILYRDESVDNNATCLFYERQEILSPPKNLEYVLYVNNVVLSWEEPDDETYLGYNLYRNDELLSFVDNHTSSPQYEDKNLPLGVYRYTLTAVYENGESTPIGPVTVSVIDGIEDTENNNLRCYPTLVTEDVIINVEEDGEVVIYNIDGKRVGEYEITTGINSISMEMMEKGMYYIIFKSDRGVQTVKVIKM